LGLNPKMAMKQWKLQRYWYNGTHETMKIAKILIQWDSWNNENYTDIGTMGPMKQWKLHRYRYNGFHETMKITQI